LVTGDNNTALGFNAGSALATGNNNIDIGTAGVSGEDNTIRIGDDSVHRATFIAAISGATVSGGAAVFVDSLGKLGTMTSSEQFKENIQSMGSASEAILALRPVTFRYKKELDPKGIPQFGLVAEDVSRVNPDLIVRDTQGAPKTVRYEQINAMLLNEFLKEHRRVQEQEVTIALLMSNDAKHEATIARLEQQIEALTAGLQKVSAQLLSANPSLADSR